MNDAFEDLFSPAFLEAARDYLWLLDRGYPEGDVARLVGNRFRLSRDQRMILYRGVLPSSVSKAHREKQVPLVRILERGSLLVDGYNILLTLLTYRLGRPVFLSTDGFLRDIGGIHGHIHHVKILEEVVEALFSFFETELPGVGIRILLDRPVSHSGDLASALQRRFDVRGLAGEVSVCDSADYELKRAGVLIATSDSAVLSRAGEAFDLAFHVLSYRYHPKRLPDLGRLLSLERKGSSS
ncbi:DUF434 domain-containing protein [Spirochaeta thermophila]|uniref:DUF434 domain-containing protein n=1 Tax=Winmispira thermophila (strain ATCC 49972 / DSM 6192 / RI 19.B1) TaxID=665571 RepID=E0RSD2_WINT6|nr:DUF434 domain-containing protein [Spirochaeta thermophila]ADN01919.1 hypothetical protein STHERM_c09730 [Spirochaeta thermophila DSM 6192]